MQLKLKTFTICMLFIVTYSFSQTGIGTSAPDASAKLDVFSTNKGFLPPRVSLSSVTDQSTIPSPAVGLLVYCKGDAGLSAGYYFWNGNAWATIATAGGSGSLAASFLRGSRTATQSIAVDGIVSFSTVNNTAGQDISLNTTNGKITLVPGNTYRLIAAVPNFSGGQRPAFMWYNETTSSYIGSAFSTYNPGDNAALAASGGIAQVIITPSVTTVLSFRMLSSLSSGSVTVGGNADFSTTGSYPWFEAQVISGNAPVTGQSVDYVSVSTISQSSIGDNRDLIFTSNNGGNIPYNTSTGAFTLSANKTYLFQAQVRANGPSSDASYIEYGFVDATSNTLLVNGTQTITSSTTGTAGFGSNPVINFIYTPTSNQTVKLRTTVTTVGTQNITSGTANITQIGSSAIINPWTLSGTNTFNTTGNVGIGTNAPSSSALLDLTSASKGLLPPRVALTSKSGTSTPIASPTIGLLIYNTANAGSGGNAVTPGYYYFNGTFWTRMDPEGWSTPVSITIGATTTAPLKGTATTDYVRYRNIGGKEYEVEYNLVRTVAGSAGSGDYLISLPGGLQFDFTATGQRAYTLGAGYNAIVAKLLNVNGDLYYTGAHNSATVIPYNATSFRVHTNNWGTNGWTFWNASYYQLGDGSSGFKMTFRFTAI